jgi:uncharacterized membrane protein YqhA
MRTIVAVVVATLSMAFGALIAGEYAFVGTTAFVASGLFGVAIAEIIASLARRVDVYLMAAAALLVEAGTVWSMWISTSHRLDLAPVVSWAGVVFGMAAAVAWLRTARGRVRGNPNAR